MLFGIKLLLYVANINAKTPEISQEATAERLLISPKMPINKTNGIASIDTICKTFKFSVNRTIPKAIKPKTVTK